MSSVFARPDWQSSINIPSVNPNAMAGRIVPDVSADAAGSTGYLMVAQGQSNVSGGTSAATPLWASLLALLMKANVPVNFVTPLFYQAATGGNGATVGSLACNDIEDGNNNTAAAGGYAAGKGYDAVTGWGSPRGGAFAQALARQSPLIS